jgi:hypothetical protein
MPTVLSWIALLLTVGANAQNKGEPAMSFWPPEEQSDKYVLIVYDIVSEREK